MTSIKITKAKLNPTKKGTGLIISFEETDDKGNKIIDPGQTHTAIVQQEILEQFDRMAIHFAIMSGYVKASQVEDIAAPDPTLSESFTVKQFSIGGDEEDGTDGVTLTGSKTLVNGKSHNFNAPFYRFNEGAASRYAFMDDLVACLRVLEPEIVAYKRGEKFGQPLTPELPFDDRAARPDAMARVAEMDNKPKRGRKKKTEPAEQQPAEEGVTQ